MKFACFIIITVWSLKPLKWSETTGWEKGLVKLISIIRIQHLTLMIFLIFLVNILHCIPTVMQIYRASSFLNWYFLERYVSLSVKFACGKISYAFRCGWLIHNDYSRICENFQQEGESVFGIRYKAPLLQTVILPKQHYVLQILTTDAIFNISVAQTSSWSRVEVLAEGRSYLTTLIKDPLKTSMPSILPSQWQG